MLIIPYLWNPKTKLDKEAVKDWSSSEIHLKTFKDGEWHSRLFSRIINNEEGKLSSIISYNEFGDKESLIEMEYPDSDTEITKMIEKRMSTKDIKKFNSTGNLIEYVEESPLGGFDVTRYFYDDKNRLSHIKYIDDDGDKTEEFFTYKNDHLFKIKTAGFDGDSMVRGFIYDNDGNLEKMIRMQDDFVNLEVYFLYNENGQRIREKHEAINRIKGGKITLMITEWTYHSNGKIKTETFQMMDSYKGILKSESTEHYSEDGRILKIEENDFEEDEQLIHEYTYQ